MLRYKSKLAVVLPFILAGNIRSDLAAPVLAKISTALLSTMSCVSSGTFQLAYTKTPGVAAASDHVIEEAETQFEEMMRTGDASSCWAGCTSFVQLANKRAKEKHR